MNTPTIIPDEQTRSVTLVAFNLRPNTAPSSTGVSGVTLTASTVVSWQLNGTFTLLASSSVMILLSAAADGLGTQVDLVTNPISASFGQVPSL